MSTRLFTQREVSRIFADVPNKTLIYWARQGLVEWVDEARDARGISRLYNNWNLFQISLVRELSSLGCSIKVIHNIMDKFFKHHNFNYVNDFFMYIDFIYFMIVKQPDKRGFSDALIYALTDFTENDEVKFQIFGQKKLKNLEKIELLEKSAQKEWFFTSFVILDLIEIAAITNKWIKKAENR